jgi:predicted kinase
VSDDENSQAATNDAFEVLYFIAAKRLRAGKLTVVDATNGHIQQPRHRSRHHENQIGEITIHKHSQGHGVLTGVADVPRFLAGSGEA